METAGKPKKGLALRLMLVALPLGLWLRLGDANPWRTVAVIAGSALICWVWIRAFSRSRARQAPAPRDRTCDEVHAAAQLRLAARERRLRPRSSKLQRDVRCPRGATTVCRRPAPRRTRPSY